MEEIEEAFRDADPFKTWWPFILAAIVFVVATIKSYMGGQHCPNSNKISDLVVLITGADGGIGSEIVKELAKRGGHIIMCCKNISNGEKVKKKILKYLPKARIDVRHLDLRSFDNVRKLVNSIESDYSKVDVLINNAGVTLQPFSKTSDGFETHLQVNYLSHFLLTHLLLPLLKHSKHARVINVAAHAYATGKMNVDDPLRISNLAPQFNSRDAFAHSKLAIVMSTKKLAEQLKPISVTVLTPGLVRGTKHMRQSPIMRAFFAKLIIFPWMWIFMKSPEQGAQTAVFLATESSISSVTGKYFNDCEVTDVVELAKDEHLVNKLYSETLRVLKLEGTKI
ncbi:hypothetical protein PVAND_001564 [Polypedilum vanderplanki]|uniref:Uncharacterized protein n=1 Tax=Polypedilum vanderplanki TaxID=319348 RepID=A0A9J6BPM4_POLVA|nr:hypothetical protein PVAND_001564 [Polypedilum vanderplanki]